MSFEELYIDLLIMVSEVGAEPDEVFFSGIIENFAGSKEECLAYIKTHLTEWFRCIKGSPEWVQSAEWQYWVGKPMVFVGQTDVPQSSGWFHDDASFFHFWDPESGATQTVIQLY